MNHRPAFRTSFVAPALLAALLASALAGCADSSRVLARVGKRVLTTDDFVETARDKEGQYPGPPDSAKAQVLDDMVRAALVLCDAERLGLYKEPGVATARAPIEIEETQRALFRRLVPMDVPVSDAEVEEMYAWRDSASHTRVVICVSRGAADAAAAELARGAQFEDVANRYGGPAGGPPGGDVGYLRPGALMPPLDRIIREAPVRTVIGPVETPGEGWFLIEVLERRKLDQRPLEQERLMLRDMLRQRKVRAIRLGVQRSLRDAYDMRLEPGGPQALFAYFNQAVGESAAAHRHASEAERATVLARYGTGALAAVYTLGDALTDMEDYQREKPNPSMLPAIERWINDQLLRRVALIEARRRHLDEEPETRGRIDRRVDSQVLDLYFDVEIAHGVEAGPDDMREAYERNRDSYAQDGKTPPLEALPPEALSALRQQAGDLARNRAFEQKVEALRIELRPEVFLDRLRAIPWPISQPPVAPRS